MLRVPRLALVLAMIGAVYSCATNPSNDSQSPRPIPTQADLSNPPEVVSSHGVAQLTLTAMLDPSTGAPVLSYGGALVAPTIRVAPGDTIDLTYVDALPESSTEPYNRANLHFHGLSVPPVAPADDAIGTIAMPGQTLHYHVVIPSTQPPGLYLYHSHAHGEANWQVSNGMSGAIVVTGVAAVAPETAGLPERVIVLRNVLTDPAYASLDRMSRPRFAANAVSPASSCAMAWTQQRTTINGVAIGTPILMQPGRQQFWRVLNASSNGYYDVSVDGQRLTLVSIDGVPLAVYPGAKETVVSDIVIPPAGRAEFLVRWPVAGGGAFRTACTDTGPTGDPNPAQVLGTIAVGAPTVPVVAAASSPLVKGTYESTLPAPSVHRDLWFTENPDTGQYFLNKQLYDPSGPPLFTAKSGTVEEWTLANATFEVHAFHIHQVHFIALDVDGVPQAPYWRDTLNLPIMHADASPSTSHVLIDFRDPAIRGTLLFHCHLLKHEDGGMMAKILVQ